ncbi:MAG: sensor histidine kinase [Acidobacteria bacterium]|nr:sensor histidine kinase [Acidobacteriota bacterium]
MVESIHFVRDSSLEHLSISGMPSGGAQHLLAAKLIQAQEDERRWLARELHDGISQQLAAIELELAHLSQGREESAVSMREGLAYVHNLTGELAQEIRGLSHRLHPAVLEHLGLVPALRSYCGDFSRRTDIPTRFVSSSPHLAVGKDVSIALYRIVQEALQNVAKHARATKAVVRLWRERSCLLLSITDNGVGFSKRTRGCKEGLGLTSMEERIRGIAGEFYLHSRRGGGTSIRVSVPMLASAKAG